MALGKSNIVSSDVMEFCIVYISSILYFIFSVDMHWFGVGEVILVLVFKPLKPASFVRIVTTIDLRPSPLDDLVTFTVISCDRAYFLPFLVQVF